MSRLTTLSPQLRDIALLVSRIILGVVLIAHGVQKLFLNGLEASGQSFAQMGVPFSGLSAGLAGLTEIIGGVLILIGLFTPLAALLVSLVMLGAFFFAHAQLSPFVQGGGWELVGVIIAGVLAVAAGGAGRYSVDHTLRERERVTRPERETVNA